MSLNEISPHISLKELFDRWPETILVFIHYRMACVGCCMSIFDTLEDAAVNYGLDCPALINELVSTLSRD